MDDLKVALSSLIMLAPDDQWQASLTAAAHDIERLFEPEVISGEVENIVTLNEEVTSFAIHPVANLVAVGMADGSIRLLRIGAGEVTVHDVFAAHIGSVQGLGFTSDSQYLFSTGADGLSQWSLEDIT